MSENIDKGGNKSAINWYPGHMAKTKRQIEEDLKLIDVVIEILDARIPKSSQNPDIQKTIKNKKKIILLNKCDLANEQETKKWQNYYKKQGIETVQINAQNGQGTASVITKIQEIMQKEIKEYEEKGRKNKTIRCLIVRHTKRTENHHS